MKNVCDLQNALIFIQEYVFENTICRMAVASSSVPGHYPESWIVSWCKLLLPHRNTTNNNSDQNEPNWCAVILGRAKAAQ